MRDQDDEFDFGNSRSIDDLLFKLCTLGTERRHWLNTFRAVNASRYDAFYNCYKPGLPSTPLYFTSSYGLFRMTERLLDHGQNVNAEGGAFGTPLNAGCLGGHTDVARVLLDRGAEINRKAHRYGLTALHLASRSGNVSLVKLLLDRGACIHIQDKNGHSPFIYACQSGDCERMKLLLDHGASIEPADSSCRAPLMTAIESEIYPAGPAIKLLLDRGAEIDQFSQSSVGLASALHYCACHGMTETAALLLDRGGTIEIQNSRGETPLRLAVKYQRSEMVEMLVERGADVFARDNEGLTPFEYALTGTDLRVRDLQAKRGVVAILTKAEEAQRRKQNTESNQQDSTGSGSVSDVTTKAEETQEGI